MSKSNSQIVSQKSLLRIINRSAPESLTECDENNADIAADSDDKNCRNTSKNPRPPKTASYSFNKTQSNDKTKQTPSMIPRLNPRKWIGNDQIKPDIPAKTDSEKDQLNIIPTPDSKESKINVGVTDSKPALTPIESQSKSSVRESKNFGQKLFKITSSLRFCQDFIDVMRKVSDIYREPKEDSSEKGGSGRFPNNELKEERTIRDLYETIKFAIEPSFDGFKRLSSENEMNELYAGDVKKCETLQEHYEFTLKEISNIWKNTVALMVFVKDRIFQFVEENNKLIDTEQLVLESEMVQLSLDLAINYSKLKTDSLVKLAKKRLNVKKLKKTELENFMDSKAFFFTYSNEDLAAMAGTLKDLNTTLVRGEEVDLD